MNKKEGNHKNKKFSLFNDLCNTDNIASPSIAEVVMVVYRYIMMVYKIGVIFIYKMVNHIDNTLNV